MACPQSTPAARDAVTDQPDWHPLLVAKDQGIHNFAFRQVPRRDVNAHGLCPDVLDEQRPHIVDRGKVHTLLRRCRGTGRKDAQHEEER